MFGFHGPGFAFVCYGSTAEATAAVTALQGAQCDGRTLAVQLAKVCMKNIMLINVIICLLISIPKYKYIQKNAEKQAEKNALASAGVVSLFVKHLPMSCTEEGLRYDSKRSF